VDAAAGLNSPVRPGDPPARIVTVREPAVGLEAIVVIDHFLFPASAGGTRLAPDVSEAEIVALARAMTWKFAVYQLPVAGAKAGIRFAGGDRQAVLRAFLAAIEPWGESFLTGPDLGTSAEDFLGPGEAGGERPLWARTHDGLGMDDLATGHGVKAGAEAALERLGRGLEGATIAIEGFGKVGAGTARACTRAGARIVGVSTIEGALLAPDGLDVAELLELRARHGDALVHHGPVATAPREALFATPCDVLVPGARPHVITPGLAATLPCAVVAPGANIPYAKGADEALHARGIVALPDFVTNAGGVHLYESPDCRTDPISCLEAIERRVAATTARVLEAAAAASITPISAALRLAGEYLERAAREA